MANVANRRKKNGIVFKPGAVYVVLAVIALLVIVCAILSGSNKRYKKNIAQLQTDLSNALTTEATTLPQTASTPAGTAYIVTTQGDSLNLRDSASDGSVIASIPSGAIVYITTISNNWGYATYSDKQGWVSMNYLTKVESGTSAAAVTAEGYYTGQ